MDLIFNNLIFNIGDTGKKKSVTGTLLILYNQ